MDHSQSRFPLSSQADQLISDVLMPAYVEYLDLYLDLVINAKVVASERASLLLEGQKRYNSYRANKDPARAMFNRFYGSDWTDSYIYNVLFDL